MCTAGIPWEGEPNKIILARVGQAGERLQLPDAAEVGYNPAFFSIIRACWEHDASNRPSFEDISNQLEELAS